MTDSTNLAVVRRFYGNLASPEILMQILSPTIRWEIVAGFPYGGVYTGVEAVFHDFFGRLFQDFSDWRPEVSEFIDAGDRVIALGTYSAHAIATGKTLAASFVHVWTLDGGLLVRLQQCADTAPIFRALER